MAVNKQLLERSGGKCELCSSEDNLLEYAVPESVGQKDSVIVLCTTCESQIVNIGSEDHQHLSCLSDSMWSLVPAVQIVAWRMLNRLKQESWASDLLDMLYLDEEMMAWAEAGATTLDQAIEPTLDNNGVALKAGDSVTIIKDLDVKGTSFVAKRGTAVRGISLTDNPKHIEGRVNGTRVVLIADYVKKN